MKYLGFWVVGWKFIKLFMSYLKLQVRFSLNLHHSSVPWKITLLYFFSWNFIFCWQKDTIKVPSFRLSISPNLYFDRFLSLKIYKISSKRSVGELHIMALKGHAKFEEKPICCFKNDKNLLNFYASTQKPQNFAHWLVPFVQSI